MRLLSLKNGRSHSNCHSDTVSHCLCARRKRIGGDAVTFGPFERKIRTYLGEQHRAPGQGKLRNDYKIISYIHVQVLYSLGSVVCPIELSLRCLRVKACAEADTHTHTPISRIKHTSSITLGPQTHTSIYLLLLRDGARDGRSHTFSFALAVVVGRSYCSSGSDHWIGIGEQTPISRVVVPVPRYFYWTCTCESFYRLRLSDGRLTDVVRGRVPDHAYDTNI